jgi:signal transduction histidine kinase/streptogramin lyase
MGVASLAVAGDNSLWVGVAVPGPGLGLQQFMNGSWKSFQTRELDGNTIAVSALLLDRENTLWVGTIGQGIYRIRGRQVEHFRSSDGLSSDMVNGFFEDREGNMWVTTAKGLDCFRDVRVASFSRREGLTADEIDAVLASRNGTVWAGGPGALDALSPANAYSIQAQRHLPGTQVTSLLEDHAGRLWVGVDNSLLAYENGKFRPVAGRHGHPIGFVVGMTEDVEQNIWAETRGSPRKLLKIRDFKVQEEFPAPKIPAARQIAADPNGGIWLGLLSGDLARYAQGKLDVFPFIRSDPPTEDSGVNHLLVNPDGSVMGATDVGVIAWRNGRRQTLTVRNGLPCGGLNALLFDNQNDLWLSARCGLVRIANSELQKWWENPDATVQVKVLDAMDGAQTGFSPFNPASRSIDGKLWFSNEIELQMVDPARLVQNTLPPPVHIEEVVANRKRYTPSNGISLPPSTRDLEIDYTGLSFTVPQKVQFRYRLQGHDANWQDAGMRRQAFYSDLPPGYYRFHVIACNNEGVWNEAGATLDFRILPAWYQTIWFRLLIAMAGMLIVWALHRLRVRQVSRTISARADERLAERTRMARELHDTFLQTIQGSKLVVGDALENSSDPEVMRRTLKQLAVWLEQAVEEGRAALNSLRESTTERNDLGESFRRVTQSNLIPSSMAVTLSVVGDVREMHPIVRDEVYRIGHEAIRNACLHSRASRLDLELRYGSDLMLRVSDNGIGIDPAVLDLGKDGHFGLQGMRERIGRIGGKFTMVSTLNTGTVVTIVIPAGLVYRAKRAKLFERAISVIKRAKNRASS